MVFRSGTIKEGGKDLEKQVAATSSLKRYTQESAASGVLHYLIHGYDDPAHAADGLKAPEPTAKAAAAVPHAQHMPSLFSPAGYWEESAATNENAWRTLKSM